MTKTSGEMWSWVSYPSGTTVVNSPLTGKPQPWLYVCMVGNPDDLDDQTDRYLMCDQLVMWLNGEASRPAWIDDMNRVSESKLLAPDGAFIEATGPMYDRNPPACDWWNRDDDEAKDMRARLIDRVHFDEPYRSKS